MIKERELNLLIDLAKLLKKYGPESFDNLSKILSSKEELERISELLNNISNASISGKNKPMKATVRKGKKKIVKEEKSNEQKLHLYEEDRSLDAWSNIILNGKTKEDK
jgi:hypothetical protein